jgi:D-alanine-D-alanine ligase
MKKIRVGIVFGGRSGEHEVSIRSARSVMAALDTDRYEAVPIGITKEGYWICSGDPLVQLLSEADQRLLSLPEMSHTNQKSAHLNRKKQESTSLIPRDQLLTPLDVIFPVLHGPYGEDGTMQGLLEMAQIPYVGCGVLASSVGMDKILFKDVMAAHNIPSVPYLSFLRKDLETEQNPIVERSVRKLGWPVFCKPANLGSSVGISVCKNAEELRDGMRTAALYDRRILIEKAVSNAREIEVSVLGNDEPIASVPGEIIPSRDFYDYASKYLDNDDDASRLIIPANISSEQADICRDLAIRAFRAIDGAGMSRVDFLIDGFTGDIFLNELNTIPGFTDISMFTKLWEASGITYSDLVTKLIELSLERFEDRKCSRTDFTPL